MVEKAEDHYAETGGWTRRERGQKMRVTQGQTQIEQHPCKGTAMTST
jgi:hypothetical protein